MKKTFFLKYQFFIITISIIFWCYLLGFNFISPTNSDWLHLGDMSQTQLGWKFFKDDIWRFPIGFNPNYGIYFDGSIVFSDSIPIFAIFFKSIKFFLPENFQYFSLWILTCIYLQLFFSFKIIFKITNNLSYSLVGSLFFCTATIFINRSGLHLSLMGQWILLSTFYIETTEYKNKLLYKILNLMMSITIHFYFTIIIILFYMFKAIYDFLQKPTRVGVILKEFSLISVSSILIMFLVGYFTINLDDGLGWGYGYYNYNLNSFFNPSGNNYVYNFNWSQFLPEQQYQNNEIEGFSYLGIIGILFLGLFFVNFFYKKYQIFYDNYKILTISLLFLILATSHNINLGDDNLLLIPINNLMYALLSSIRASGRLVWPVYYLIFIFGIIFIFKIFKDKYPTVIILILLFIQILDISSGLQNYRFGFQYINKNSQELKSKIWEGLSKDFEEIRMITPKNHSSIYNRLSKYLLNENFKKTDIAYLARVNRESIILKKYELINLFNQKNFEVFKKTIFISDNINIVRNLYYLYKNELYYYYKDNLWIISAVSIDKIYINESIEKLLDTYEINLAKTNTVNLTKGEILPIGMGWLQDIEKNNLVIDGYFASILLKIQGMKCHKNSKIIIKLDKYFKKYNESINLNLVINEGYKQKININNDFNNEISLNFDCKVNEINKIDFIVDQPKSLFDLKKGLNRTKKSIILKSLVING